MQLLVASSNSKIFPLFNTYSFDNANCDSNYLLYIPKKSFSKDLTVYLETKFFPPSVTYTHRIIINKDKTILKLISTHMNNLAYPLFSQEKKNYPLKMY